MRLSLREAATKKKGLFLKLFFCSQSKIKIFYFNFYFKYFQNMLLGGKVVVFFTFFFQYLAKNLALTLKKFVGEFFLAKSLFGYLKTKKRPQ